MGDIRITVLMSPSENWMHMIIDLEAMNPCFATETILFDQPKLTVGVLGQTLTVMFCKLRPMT